MIRQITSLFFLLLFATSTVLIVRSQTAAPQSLPLTAANGPADASTNIRAAAASNSEQPPALRERNPRYQLTPGDSIDINFKFSPELNQKDVHVQPDGF